MNNKKIMILGAGIYQVPLINKAKELGYYTIVVSIKGNYPGFSIADRIYYEDTANIDACLKIAKDENISGVCTTGTDVAIPALGAVCETLGLPGVSKRTAELSSNKLLMKECFENNNVRSAKYIKVENIEECKNACKEINFPAILKVVDSSGSRGICIINNKSDIEDAYKSILPYTKQKYIIVEQFLKGEEFGAQAFVEKNEIKFILPHGDYVYKAKTGIPIGHFVPYEGITEDIIQDIYEQLRNSIEALNINNSAINADLMLCNGKVYILEIGARAGATCLPEIVSEYYGIDYYEYILRVSMNDNPKFITTSTNSCVGYLLYSEKSGILNNIKLPPRNENIIKLSIDYAIGDRVRKFENGTDRIGEVIIKGKTLPEAKKNYNEIINKIYLKIE